MNSPNIPPPPAPPPPVPPPPPPPPPSPPPRPPRYSVTQLSERELPYGSAPAPPVRGRVIVQEAAQAFAHGMASSAAPEPAADRTTMAFFTDASCSRPYNIHGEGYTSAAFVHKLPQQQDEDEDEDEDEGSRWIGHGHTLPVTCSDINNAELWAIALTLEFIVRCLAAGLHPAYAAVALFQILTDSKEVLRWLHGGDSSSSPSSSDTACEVAADPEALRRVLYYDAALTLLLNKAVEYRWVPSHSGVPGNEAADRLAGAFRPDVLLPLKYRLPPAAVVEAAMDRWRPYRQLRVLAVRLDHISAAVALATSHGQRRRLREVQRKVEREFGMVLGQINAEE